MEIFRFLSLSAAFILASIHARWEFERVDQNSICELGWVVKESLEMDLQQRRAMEFEFKSTTHNYFFLFSLVPSEIKISFFNEKKIVLILSDAINHH